MSRKWIAHRRRTAARPVSGAGAGWWWALAAWPPTPEEKAARMSPRHTVIFGPCMETTLAWELDDVGNITVKSFSSARYAK